MGATLGSQACKAARSVCPWGMCAQGPRLFGERYKASVCVPRCFCCDSVSVSFLCKSMLSVFVISFQSHVFRCLFLCLNVYILCLCASLPKCLSISVSLFLGLSVSERFSLYALVSLPVSLSQGPPLFTHRHSPLSLTTLRVVTSLGGREGTGHVPTATHLSVLTNHQRRDDAEPGVA